MLFASPRTTGADPMTPWQNRHPELCILALLVTGLTTTGAAPAPEDTEVWEPVPPVVTPGDDGAPPSDAVVLFDGTNLDAWQREGGGDPAWRVGDGWFEVVPGTGAIETRQTFGDVQLHIEWRTPAPPRGEGQDRGNSGIFLQKRYEVQVLDSFESRTYSNGQAASIYKQSIPLVNATRPPGEWQTYDIIYHAPRFRDDGTLGRPATITVLHNGVLVQDHFTIRGATEYIGPPSYAAHGADSLALQDHDHPVRYRNVWLRKLSAD
jgi:3-keto-disaccharide hydrolase